MNVRDEAAVHSVDDAQSRGEGWLELLADEQIDASHRHVIARVANFAKRARRYSVEFYCDDGAFPCLPSVSINYTPLAKKKNDYREYEREVDYISSGMGGLLPTLASTYDEVHVGITFHHPVPTTVYAKLWYKDRLIAKRELVI